VLVPKGQYLIGSPLIIPNGVHLCGESPQSSQIVAKSSFDNSSMITNTDHAGHQEYCFISNLYLAVQAGARMSYGIDVSTVFVNSFIRDCIIAGIPGVGLHLEAADGSAGPIQIVNNWIVNSSHQNILMEVPKGNSGGVFANIDFTDNTTEHCGAGYANFQITNNGNPTAYPINVLIDGHHFEQASVGEGTSLLYVDGCLGLIAENLGMYKGAKGALTGVQITNNPINVRQFYRAIGNVNLIDPILSDAKNNVSFGPVNLSYYATNDATMVTGSIYPGVDNGATLGRSGNRWSAVWAANGTIQTSDMRLKRDIVQCDRGLADLLRLAPVSYQWADGTGDRRLGLVAQAVQDVVPEAVTRGDDPERLLGLEYAQLIPVIINAIQELDARTRRGSP
jgi:hypothetical protein